MKLFKNWYADYKLLKKENQYYTTECWVKEEKIREICQYKAPPQGLYLVKVEY